jgi:hypothetical protein
MTRHTSWSDLDRHARELLDGPERRAVEAHVHECDECREALRRLHREEQTLRDALEPAEGDDEAIEETLAAAAKAPAAVPKRWGAFIPLAAAAILVVTLVVMTLRPNPAQDAVGLAVEEALKGRPDELIHLNRKALPALRGEERLASLRPQLEASLPRLLWVEAHPHSDFMQMRTSLLQDTTLFAQTLVLENRDCDASSWSMDRLPFQSPIKSFPTADLASYDVAVLGGFRATDVAVPRSIDTFVRSYGGGVLMISVEGGMRPVWESISPVRLLDESRKGTAKMIERHPASAGFEAARQLRWVQAVRPKPGARVLVSLEDGSPILTVWECGRGRVAHLASNDLSFWKGDTDRIAMRAAYSGIIDWLVSR